MINIGDYVKVTKLEAAENSHYPTPDRIGYICGEDNGNISTFKGYEVEGFILCEPKIGSLIWIDRKFRNGVQINGFFKSSIIQKIQDNKVYTMNSVYEIEKI